MNSGTVRVGDTGSPRGGGTRVRVKDVVFREIDRVKVKGKDEAITIYEPLGLQGEGRALELWRGRSDAS